MFNKNVVVHKIYRVYILCFSPYVFTFSCEIAMGDIQSEEGRDLVLELELPPVLSSEHVPLVSVELSYFNVITSQFDTVQCQLTTNRTGKEFLVLCMIILESLYSKLTLSC